MHAQNIGRNEAGAARFGCAGLQEVCFVQHAAFVSTHFVIVRHSLGFSVEYERKPFWQRVWSVVHLCALAHNLQRRDHGQVLRTRTSAKLAQVDAACCTQQQLFVFIS